MPQLRYSVAASLDGYIAGPDGEFDWIPMDPDIDFAGMYASYSHLVMGRRSYEVFLATGGGVVLSGQNRDALRDNGIVVYLKSAVHDLWQRTRHDRSRPLLQTEDPRNRLKELYEQRDPLYTQVADLVMPTGKQSVHSLVQQLQQELDRIAGTGHRSH